ncbi:putative transmembrane emp24 domain-containing protein p24beta3-like [Cocos nucifera]|uniref:Putative transmembrane emp24 domain-containing protein p24beta3-like n=1 Tax=Cocos nucifera TaxID=13894 RepID=A0A8K0IXJ2_COCNU|nr:putative transmembrane emp24 domain-containing protein p24beta3-like [Cocos nucifera]
MERRERSIQFAEVLLILGLLLSCPQRLSALSVTVNDVECVYEYVLYEGDTVSGNFVVVDHDLFWSSDHPGIDLVVTSPGGNTVHSLKGTSGDKFEFKAPQAGMYKFCFHNPDRTPETVSFYIHVGHIPNEQDLAKDEHLDPINVKIAQLREALESVTAEQRLFASVDDIYCLFPGRIGNIAHLKQQGSYPADQVVRDLNGKFAFILFDCSAKSTFMASDTDGSIPFYWGTDSGDHLVFSDDVDVIKKGCGKSFAAFPKGCFFATLRGLQSFKHPLNEVKLMLRVDSQGEVCGVTYEIDAETKKGSGRRRVGSAANWSSHY